MRESGGKRKEAGTVERFPPILLMSKRVLASHPPSCHPWRVFGFPESGEKMRESGGKRKEAGTVERFPPILLMSKSSLWL